MTSRHVIGAGRSTLLAPPSAQPVPFSFLRTMGWLAVILIALLAIFGPLPDVAGRQPAPGNNGTVKIHDGDSETEPIVHNEPHVCTFHLHFFFADPAQKGDWRIESWPPTGDETVVLSGTYNTSPTGEDRRPTSGPYSLPSGHYKLFWKGDEADLWEHKVFWVECAPLSPSPSASASTSPSPSASASTSPSPSASASPSPSASASPSPSASVLPSTEASASPEGSVLAETATPRKPPPPTDALPAGTTGGNGLRLALLALAGLLAGMLTFTHAPKPTRR